MMRSQPLRRTPFRSRRKRTRITKDGRLILSPEAWSLQRKLVYERDGGRCRRCRKPILLSQAEIDHKRKRGMGGGTRDDRIRNLRTLCRDCHRERHRLEP